MNKPTAPYRSITSLSLAFLLFGAVHRAEALSLAIVESDPAYAAQTEAGLLATGDFSSITLIDAGASTPTLAALTSYDAVLAYTDAVPADGTALGNVLASYYDLGGKSLTLATYAFSTPYEIGGTVMTGDYAALVDVGQLTTPSGHLVATVPTDPIFAGLDLSQVSYFTNFRYADPGLAAGATLLATDGAGTDLIARSANGVIDVNIFPGTGASSTTYQLLADTLGGQAVSPVPEPGTALFGIACTLAVGLRRKRKAAGI